jgi:hypothetical protein
MNRLHSRVKALEQRLGATEEQVDLSWFRAGFSMPRSAWDALLREVLGHGRSLGPGYVPPDHPVQAPTQEVPGGGDVP